MLRIVLKEPIPYCRVKPSPIIGYDHVSTGRIYLIWKQIKVSLCEKLPARLPRSGHGEWRNTFALHALVAAILHTAYMIEAAQYQVNLNMLCRDTNGSQDLPGPTIAAIVLAACNCGLLYYLTFCFMTDK